MNDSRFATMPARTPWNAAARAMGMLLGTVIAQGAMAQGNPAAQTFDYFTARGSERLTVVEQFHLGPCERNYRARDWKRAMNECNFILRYYPNHPAALLLVTQVCEQWKSAACLLDDTFERAVAINPKAPGTYVVQGIYLNRTKQYATAIERFKTALELDPDNMNAHYNIALTYLDSRQFDLANQHAQRAYALGATPPGLRNRLRQAGHWNPADPLPTPPDNGSAAAPPARTTGKSQ